MKIKNYMTKHIITASMNKDILQLSKLMTKYDIGFIPITNESKIIGIITDRDIVTRIIYNKDTKINDYITKNIIYVDENQSINDALLLMKKHKIKRLLVTSNNLKVSGIISLSDIIKCSNPEDIYDTISEIYEINKNEIDNNVEIDSFYL